MHYWTGIFMHTRKMTNGVMGMFPRSRSLFLIIYERKLLFYLPKYQLVTTANSSPAYIFRTSSRDLPSTHLNCAWQRSSSWFFKIIKPTHSSNFRSKHKCQCETKTDSKRLARKIAIFGNCEEHKEIMITMLSELSYRWDDRYRVISTAHH